MTIKSITAFLFIRTGCPAYAAVWLYGMDPAGGNITIKSQENTGAVGLAYGQVTMIARPFSGV